MKKKINILLALVFLSIIVVALNKGNYHNEVMILGATLLNGNGCVCHGLDADTSVIVWVEGPDTLYGGETALYRMFLTGGPAEGGGYNVAGRFGIMTAADSTSVGHPLAPNELTQAFTLPFPSTEDTVFWAFYYTASDSFFTDTIYSVGISCVWDSIPDEFDRWNFGPNFPIAVLPAVTYLDESSQIADEFILFQNFPNPFNPSTKIKFFMSQTEYISLKIYDILGSEIAVLANEKLSPGVYEYEFDGSNFKSGVYFYRLSAGYRGQFTDTKKLLLIK